MTADNNNLVEMFNQKLERVQEQTCSLKSISDNTELEAVKKELLGKAGTFAELSKILRDLPSDIRPEMGRKLNELKKLAEKELEDRLSVTGTEAAEDVSDLDYTLPGQAVNSGNLHLITKTLDQILDVFRDMGFHIVEGPDIEDEWHNFEALGFHPDHPARDTQDSFYLAENQLLKTHTSPIQIRYMENNKPPIQMVAPGYCFRRDPFTSRHSPVFLQIEALMVDKDISFAHLKGVLTEFVRGFFGRERIVRFRPDFFPFVEPGCELAMDCPFCKGHGCRVCSHSGWIEILGAGMVHPKVLSNCRIDPEKYTGFAFGMGVERTAMIRFGIDDIRHFYENDFRFLEQFR